MQILRPDDMHLHLRDTPYLESVIAHTAERFGRAIVMPNLKPPVLTPADASAYRDRILRAAKQAGYPDFEPLMTLYLTEQTPVSWIKEAAASRTIHGIKLYPAGATTHSDAGVRNIQNIRPQLEALQECGLPLLVHAESTRPDVDVFDREKAFLEEEMSSIVRDFPALRIVLEHVTTTPGVAFVRAHKDRMAATITAHHLLINRSDIFRGGMRPHLYCLPVAKTESDRLELLSAAVSGESAFFLGTDSAPHPRSSKESGCCPAGIYTAHAGIELYAMAFARAGLGGERLRSTLEKFSSIHGAAFYKLPPATDTITLEVCEQTIPESFPLGSEEVVPFLYKQKINYKLKKD
ncbi:MAG: dihydroorotase [Spirochaetales bacterium]|nr:dihydroorotase [Spirochaetales bacterium]